jgi:hypothetical protein
MLNFILLQASGSASEPWTSDEIVIALLIIIVIILIAIFFRMKK